MRDLLEWAYEFLDEVWPDNKSNEQVRRSLPRVGKQLNRMDQKLARLVKIHGTGHPLVRRAENQFNKIGKATWYGIIRK